MVVIVTWRPDGCDVTVDWVVSAIFLPPFFSWSLGPFIGAQRVHRSVHWVQIGHTTGPHRYGHQLNISQFAFSQLAEYLSNKLKLRYRKLVWPYVLPMLSQLPIHQFA